MSRDGTHRVRSAARWLFLGLAASCLTTACAVESARIPARGDAGGQRPGVGPRPAQADFTAEDFSLMLGLIQRSGDLIVRRDPIRAHPTNYADLAYSCIGLLEAARKLTAVDPERSRRFGEYGRAIADHLIRDKDMNHDGKTGWGLDSAYTDQTTRVTIPAHQEYAFQTGIGGYCLLEVYELTKNARYLETAREAVATFSSASTTRIDPRCANCAYFWYSTHPDYFGRYIKNTNVLMGMVVARLARITGDPDYRARALQVFNSEKYEIDVRRNFNYLGAHDPRFAPRPEKHMAPEMWAFEKIAHELGVDNRATMAAMIDFYWRCGDPCAANVTAVPGIFAGCVLAHHGEPSRSKCRESVRFYSPPNPNQLVDSFALVGVVRAFVVSQAAVRRA